MSSPTARRLTQVEVPVEQRWATRVVLQPIAAPSVLGLAGLSVSLLTAGTLQAKWWGTQADLLQRTQPIELALAEPGVRRGR